MPTPASGLGQGLGSASFEWKELGPREAASPVYDFETDNSRSTRIFRIPWDNRAEAVARILGYSFRDDSTNPPTLRRYLPEVDPAFPWLVATRVHVQGIGWNDKETIYWSPPPMPGDPSDPTGDTTPRPLNHYVYAILTVEFSVPDYSIKSDDDPAITDPTDGTEFNRYTSYEVHPTSDYLDIPTGTMVWAGTAGVTGDPPHGGQTFPGAAGKIISLAEFVWTWHEIPEDGLPFNTISNTIGRVNSDTFANSPPHTLLLADVQYKRTRTAYGTFAWDIAYHVRYNPNLHTKFYDWKAAPGGYFQVRQVSGPVVTPGLVSPGTLVFDETPFADLFVLE